MCGGLKLISCGWILGLVQFTLFCFSKCTKTRENKNVSKDKIEPQQLHKYFICFAPTFNLHSLVLYQQLTFIFSWFYIRFYQDHAQSEVSSTLTAIVALAITLLTTALVPVDIFIVSYMKNDDGTWKVCCGCSCIKVMVWIQECPGGTSDFKWPGWLNEGKPQKIPRASSTTPKSPWTKD